MAKAKERASSGRYDAGAIRILGGIEHVRLRPAMYIGDTGERGLHHLVEEVVANSIDEVMAGECSRIHVCLHTDGSVSVTDNGRGIPVDLHPETKTPALEVVMTTLNAGGKFDDKVYSMSAGLHGVGVSCVNALSEWMEAEVWRDGNLYYQRYEFGRPITPVEKRGKTDRRGTRIVFLPDSTIFKGIRFNYDLIARRLRELAFLNSGVEITLSSEVLDKKETFHYEGGIQQFVEFLNEGRRALHEEVVYIQSETGRVRCAIAFQYHDGYTESVISFANNINTLEGGGHLSGFRSALTRTFNAYARKRNLVKDATPTGEDYREGLTAVVSVWLPNPQFEGQTKAKLGNSELQGVVEQIVNENLARFCEENPSHVAAIIQKAVDAARAREAAKKARELTRRKGALSGGSLPGKLRDCACREAAQTELFIVEGQSAGGTAGLGRDREFQAIFPLRGVILNVEKARVDKMLSNQEITGLITVLGTGIGKEDFNADKLRYGKIVIMTDADIDGAHIRTLLLTFFFRQMPELIERGHVYIAQPPLYKVTRKGRTLYVHDDSALQRTFVELAAAEAKLEYRFNGKEHSVVLEHEDLKEFFNLVVRLERLLRRIEQRGVSPERYLKMRRKDDGCSFPLYFVPYTDARGQSREYFCYTESDYDELIARLQEELEEGQELEIIEEDDYGALSRRSGLANTLRPRKLPEARQIGRVVSSMEDRGIPIEHFLPEGPEGTQKRFWVHSNGGTIGVGALREILPVVRDLGRQGLDIQRYKGLGEMNASELAETTLKPGSRKLVQVSIGDAIKADNYFSILAGTDVGRRREFIERHALEVANLDI